MKTFSVDLDEEFEKLVRVLGNCWVNLKKLRNKHVQD